MKQWPSVRCYCRIDSARLNTFNLFQLESQCSVNQIIEHCYLVVFLRVKKRRRDMRQTSPISRVFPL